MFFDNEIINLLVIETNRYARYKISKQHLSGNVRTKKWKDVDKKEIKQFFGIIMWMGLVKIPSVSSYWSSNKLYNCNISTYMSRNCFELSLSILHVSDNIKVLLDFRLYKIQFLEDLILNKYKNALIPEENVCIDEFIVSFKGRLKCPQFISDKRHQYRINIFNLIFTPLNIKYMQEKKLPEENLFQ